MTAPTDRSMPPVMRIGVSATASKPSSAFSRAISKTFESVKKLGATSAKIATSATSATARKGVGRVFRSVGTKNPPDPLCPRVTKRCIPVGEARERISGHRDENNGALDGALPIRADAQERERGPDRAKQHHAENGAGNRAASACDRRTADQHCRNHFQLEPEARIRRDLAESHRVQDRRKSRECAKDAKS